MWGGGNIEGWCRGSLSIITIDCLLLDGNTGAVRPRKRRVAPSVLPGPSRTLWSQKTWESGFPNSHFTTPERREYSAGGPPRFLWAGITQHQGLDRRSLRRPHTLVGRHLLDPRLDVAAHSVCRRGFRLPSSGAVHTQRPTEGFAQCLGWEHTSAV